ncbi:hypothetical protein [Solibacillus merdavium]|uniref:Uncharacterized protein n=1 Tax=Solibacillus merdavium TaxID=2762218 RepID=A0ABR8XMI0_9BACL|nr:hypothetical protein [Solibacillus merdavium]MBD8033134.1 hypothetical protein [Solibacillus merdavium]
MGFLKDLGEGAGWLVGNVTGGIIKGVGELTNSDFIQEVGEGVKNSTEFVGKQLGNVAEGAWNVGSGIVTKDDYKIDQGFDDLGEGVGNTAKAIGQGISVTVNNIGDVAGGLMDGDSNRSLEGAKQLGKTALIATLGVSVLDMANVVDVNGNEGVNIAQESDVKVDHIQVENTNSHTVEPHWRTLPSGETIWVDGDGNTDVNLSAQDGGGWSQSNPDYRIPTDKA